MPSDRRGRPGCVCCDYPYPRGVRLTHKGVRATFIVCHHDLKVSTWPPLQGRSHIARPNAPPRSIFQLDDMTLVMPCNQHILGSTLYCLEDMWCRSVYTMCLPALISHPYLSHSRVFAMLVGLRTASLERPVRQVRTDLNGSGGRRIEARGSLRRSGIHRQPCRIRFVP
jgi:hypothetical protein